MDVGTTPLLRVAVVVSVGTTALLRVAVVVGTTALLRVAVVVPVPRPVPLKDRTARVRVAVRVNVPLGVSEIARERVPLGVKARERVEELVAKTPKTRHKKVRNLIISYLHFICISFIKLLYLLVNVLIF